MKDRKDIFVYTGVFSRPDVLFEPCYEAWSVPLYCYTDMKFLGKSVWKMRRLVFDGLSGRRQNRKVKICWPVIFRGYDYSLYIDSTVELLVKVTTSISPFFRLART